MQRRYLCRYNIVIELIKSIRALAKELFVRALDLSKYWVQGMLCLHYVIKSRPDTSVKTLQLYFPSAGSILPVTMVDHGHHDGTDEAGQAWSRWQQGECLNHGTLLHKEFFEKLLEFWAKS